MTLSALPTKCFVCTAVHVNRLFPTDKVLKGWSEEVCSLQLE